VTQIGSEPPIAHLAAAEVDDLRLSRARLATRPLRVEDLLEGATVIAVGAEYRDTVRPPAAYREVG
jgi:hypothetical protein